MTPTPPFSYKDYLDAKQAIDDAALNPRVFRQFTEQLTASMHRHSHPRILEVGAGTGSMLKRLLDRNLLPHGTYTALDHDQESLETALEHIRKFGQSHGWTAGNISTQGNTTTIQLSRQGNLLEIELVCADILDFAREAPGADPWGVLLAHAVLDLLPLPSVLPDLFSLLAPGGFYLFTLNYDGITHFEPAIDPVFDRLVEERYHASMDNRTIRGQSTGGKYCGRKLLGYLPEAGAEIRACGSSDWIVHPVSGAYPPNTAFFLRCILQTVESALRHDPRIDSERFHIWMDRRYEQLAEGSLVYLAHQLDFFGSIKE